MKKYINISVKALIAGLFIGIAGFAYLAIENKYIGALVFSLGLLVICVLDLYLFTSRSGYLVDEHKFYFVTVLFTLLFNMIGMLIISAFVYAIGNEAILEKASSITALKLDNEWYKSLLLAIFCGMLMHIAGYVNKNTDNKIARVVVVIFAVMMFLLSGCEHSIANILYFTIGGLSWKAVGYFFLIALGNMIGAVGLEALLNLAKNKRFVSKWNYKENPVEIPPTLDSEQENIK